MWLDFWLTFTLDKNLVYHRIVDYYYSFASIISIPAAAAEEFPSQP